MGVEDPQRAERFWSRALGYVRRAPRYERDEWVALVPPEGEQGIPIALDYSETPVQEHPRIHLDLYVGDAADQSAEVERLVSLGAREVEWDLYPEDPDFVVLADPEVTVSVSAGGGRRGRGEGGLRGLRCVVSRCAFGEPGVRRPVRPR